jgi:hypothetical protein
VSSGQPFNVAMVVVRMVTRSNLPKRALMGESQNVLGGVPPAMKRVSGRADEVVFSPGTKAMLKRLNVGSPEKPVELHAPVSSAT